MSYRDAIDEKLRVLAERPEAPLFGLGAHSKIRKVTCGSCGGTFAAYVYPPRKCELCDVSFRPADKVETREGDTLGKVLERAERKQLRKGKRK